jgi:hypothetical protein
LHVLGRKPRGRGPRLEEREKFRRELVFLVSGFTVEENGDRVLNNHAGGLLRRRLGLESSFGGESRGVVRGVSEMIAVMNSRGVDDGV